MQTVSLWDDAHTRLTTPEQVELRLGIANIGSRGLAIMTDFAIRYGLLFFLYIILALVMRLEPLAVTMDLGAKSFAILFFLIVFVSEWFYFTLFEWWWNGQTPGKRLLGLRVIKMDGLPITWIEVVLRNFVRPIDTTGPMALIGMAFILFHPRGQRPGDLLARTIVIRETQMDWKLFFPEEKSDAGNQSQRTPAPLLPVEWEMLQRYLSRADKLKPETRTKLAAQLRQALVTKVKGTDLEQSAFSDEEWLRELSRRA